jgi:hypothetical protein
MLHQSGPSHHAYYATIPFCTVRLSPRTFRSRKPLIL